MKQTFKALVCLFSLHTLISVLPVHASPDYNREARWASEIIPSILVGEPIYLSQPNGHAFLGIYAPSESKKTVAILAHGMGLHPDWGFISVLRQQLNDFGYSTLSIQMPVLEATASFDNYSRIFPDAVERLQITTNHLKRQGYTDIVLVSHSNGSRMSRIFMTGKPENIDAWVAISLTRGETFRGVNVPVLDIYGENDLPHVLSSVIQRRKSFNDNKTSYQVIIKEADHFYVGQEDLLVKVIKKFLDNLNPS